MITQEKDIPTLDQEGTAKLNDFARACKAAARAVSLYPSSHPAIRLSLARLVDAASRITAKGSVTLGVVPDNLLLDGAGSPRPDQAVRETAALFHDRLIGLITLHSSPDPEGWLPFLNILAKSFDEVRASGGFGRLWAATGQRHLEIQEIDYADILKERAGGQQSQWNDIIRACLNLDSPLDEAALRELLEVCGNAERFSEFVLALEENGETSMGSKASALLRMLRGVVDLVSRTDPTKIEPLLKTLAQGFGTISPELLLELLSTEEGRADKAADLVLQVASRMTDATLGGFVAKGVIAEGGATTRLAQAFQALVPDNERRPGLLEIARAQVAESPLGQSEGFLDLWKNAANMLTSYSDEQFVSESYARELAGARTQALEVERVSDDPPDRIGSWITTVGAAEVRALDLQLLLDLLTIETDPERWKNVTGPVVSHIEDLLLVGDFEGALQLLTILTNEASGDGARKAAAAAAIARLSEGMMMTHVVTHLRTVDDVAAEQIKKICYLVGPSIVKALAEAIAIEKRAAARQRYTQILLGFGAAGKNAVEQLRASANPAVRRTAVHLLREFGGSEALPDLTTLLDDTEPQVQREAVRAILSIGTEEAYNELQKALATGTNQTREALTSALVAMRSERAIPLFEYIVRKIDRKGPLRSVYLRAVESLGALKAEQTIDLLKDALYSGEWWAPLRTAELRRVVATALRHIGTPEAQQVLHEAANSGPRGVRAAVRAAQS
ncbi:MAG TPA: HEAT repeat domain-containing protein [Vicinamibacterales bacterium]|nr:HEAT repeat domain-containing protein [Vicinamibacterales bacterium]